MDQELGKRWKLSVHDVVPVGPGETAGEAIRNAVELARAADELGYTRYWFAEHHNSATLACSQPAMLIAQAAAVTTKMRLGSGGVMLPNHSSLTIAEQYRTLEALHPGRIDLGIGRAPGTDGKTALALRRSRHTLGAADFPEQMDELLGYFEGDLPQGHPSEGILPVPAQAGNPEIWMLGSSEGGTETAAIRGLPFAFASHLNAAGAAHLMQAYKRFFQPSRYLRTPYSIYSCSVICAETQEEVDQLAAVVDLMWVRLALGNTRDPAPTVEEALAFNYTGQLEAVRRENRKRHIIGTPGEVWQQLTQRATEAMADEIMVLGIIFNHAQRLRMYELLANAFELEGERRGSAR